MVMVMVRWVGWERGFEGCGECGCHFCFWLNAREWIGVGGRGCS